MKNRRSAYIAIGSFLIVFNLLTDIVQPDKQKGNAESAAYNAGYFFGAHLLLFIGIVLLIMAYRLHKKIKRLSTESEIDQIGK